MRLAAGETKNRKEFALPLTGEALGIVRDLLQRQRVEPDDRLIPLSRGNKRFSDWSYFTEQLDESSVSAFIGTISVAASPANWPSTASARSK